MHIINILFRGIGFGIFSIIVGTISYSFILLAALFDWKEFREDVVDFPSIIFESWYEFTTKG